MIREGLYQIATGYANAVREPLRGHPLAKFIRSEFPAQIQELLANRGDGKQLVARGTKFIGAWATTPWVSVLNTQITNTTQRGVYAVYAFSRDGKQIFLSLGIGVTNTDSPFRLVLIKHLQQKYQAPAGFGNGPLSVANLGADFSPTRFDDAQAFFTKYLVADLPTEESLQKDLFSLLDLISEIAGENDSLVVQAASEMDPMDLPSDTSMSDIEAAFRVVTENDWKGKPGIEPYWHVIVGHESKPVKAVYSALFSKDVGQFTTNIAKDYFQKQGYACINKSEPSVPADKLCLVGTWRYADAEFDDKRALARSGGWASGWSFRVNPIAEPLLKPPFYVYLNRGSNSINARMRVEEYRTTADHEGMETPWPQITEPVELNTKTHSPGKVFHSWFKVTDIEKLDKPLSVQDLVPYTPISKATSLLNQHVFGYFTLPNKSLTASNVLSEYSINEATKGLFLDLETFEDALQLLREKKNLVLSGPPGVGKTYVAERLAFALLKAIDPHKVGRVQFHQSYSYEDFIQGYRPTKDGRFALRNGIFFEFCKKARDAPNDDFVFIIDEINRGNLSKILGEVLMLIEADKRGEKWALSLAYASPDDVKFFVPGNVHIIGMMNTADRSLAIVDYALRRRFAFVDLEPAIDSKGFREFIADRGAGPELVEAVVERIGALNKKICEDRELGPGYQIGHSYFCGYSKQEFSQSLYERIVRFEIEPLLREYWFDRSEEELQKIIQPLFS